MSVVRRLLPQPSSLERQPIQLGPLRWVDVPGRALRRRWTARLSAAICGTASLASDSASGKTSSSSAQGRSFAPELSLASPAQPQRLVGTSASAYQCCRCSRFSGQQLLKEEWPTQEAFFKKEHIPLSESGGQGSFVLLLPLSLFFGSRLAPWKRFHFRVAAWDTTKTDLKPLHLQKYSSLRIAWAPVPLWGLTARLPCRSDALTGNDRVSSMRTLAKIVSSPRMRL